MLGGKMDMPSIGKTGEPREVTGKVKLISDGLYRNLGPASAGLLMDMGPTVVFDTGKVEIVVISRQQEPNDKTAGHSEEVRGSQVETREEFAQM